MTTVSTDPPPGLGVAGERLWQDVVGFVNGELRADRAYVLRQAAHEADTIANLQAQLDPERFRVRGSMGQEVADPVLIEVRLHRSTLRLLLAQLGLDGRNGRRELSTEEARRRASFRRRHGRENVWPVRS